MKWILWGLFAVTVLGSITVATVSFGGMEIQVSALDALGYGIGRILSVVFESIATLALFSTYLIVGIAVAITLWRNEAFRKMLNRALLTAVWLFFGLLGAALYFIGPPYPLAIKISYWCFATAGLFFIWREVLGLADRREKKRNPEQRPPSESINTPRRDNLSESL